MATLPDEEFQLSPEETQALEEDLVFLSSNTPSTSGKRKVSGALLTTPPSSQGRVSRSSSSSASVRFRSFSSSPDFTLDLPQSAISIAALEFIGFTAETAADIFRRFTSRPSPDINPDDLLDYVHGHTSMLSTNSYQHYLPAQAMTQIGLTQQIQDTILDPRFSVIFGTKTLHFWVDDTLRINYLTLIQLLDRLKNQATRSIAKKTKRAKLNDIFPLKTSSSQQVTTTATLNVMPEDHYLPKNFVAVDKPSEILEDHYVLYKAKAAAEMGEPQWIHDDGSLQMGAITSYSECDFNHRGEVLYWTPEAETAEIYRAFAARRCPWSDTWVIRIQIPKTFINSLRQQDLWYSKDWKEYVWYCRKKMKPPEKFNSYWQAGGVDLIKGHIYTGVHSSITRIKKEEVQRKITEDNVLPISSGRATQWVFTQYDIIDRLDAEIHGKIYIEITSAEQGQEKWRVAY
jgi:hypothetical protein